MSKWIVALLLANACLLAQIGGGSIVGNTRDATGAAVAGVKIVAHNEDTNQDQRAVANAEGYYEFPLLPAGRYHLEAEAPGFDKLRGEVFDLATGTRPRIDLDLTVGSVNQTVAVTATAPLVNTTTTDLGVVMSRRNVDELPLNGRNFEDLVGLQAGVLDSPGNSAGSRGGISFHGSAALGTNLLLDGVDMSFGEVNGTAGFKSAGGGSTLINAVSIEAVEQFKSTASASSAEYGRAGGGVLNVVTRSGTNTFHGTLFDFFRNDKLNANDFFSNKNGLTRPPLRWNQYGANFGGPIRKDRIFFFFNYEGNQVKRYAKVTGNVPTPALLALVTPEERNLLALLPTTFAPTSNQYIGLHTRNDQQVNDENTYLGRVDALLAPQQRLAVRANYNNQTYTSPNLEPTMPTVYPLRYLNSVVEHTWTLGPSALNELRLGFNRVDLNRNPQGYQNISAWITVQGINASQNNYIHFLPTTYTLADNFTRIAGRHSMKFGFDIREVRSVRDQGGPPSYAYNTTADLFAQKPATVGLSFGGSKGQRTVNMGYYFQDDWHVSNNLQVNLGLRYEYSPPMRGGFNVTGPDAFGTFNRPQQPMFAADRNDFGPRVGIVWAPRHDQKTVIRTGSGIAYIMPQPIFYYDMAYINPALPGVASLTAADVPAQYLVYPAIVGFQGQVQNNPSLLPTSFRLSRSVADFNRRDTYVASWNLAVQQQLNSNLAVQAAYVGQRTVKLISVRPLNLVDPNTGQRQDNTLGQINFEENAANISYHALEISINQRRWRGLSYDAYFTWAKELGYYTPDDTITFTGSGLQNPLNISGSNGPVEGIPNKYAKAIFSYAIPAGKSLHNRVARALIAGWTLRGIIGWRSGLPINVVSGNDFAGNGRSAGQRPDAVAGVDPYIRDTDGLVWLNAAAFSTVAPKAERRFGNLGFDALTGPGAFTMDSGLHKMFSINERQKLTVRLECFNTLNHPVFSNPVATVNNANFAQITGAGSPRLYQVAMKYAF